MPFASDFDIPRDLSPAQQDLHQDLDAANAASPVFATPEKDVAADAYYASVAQSDVFRSAGIFVSGIATKATEGMSSMLSKFGNNIPFLKAGAGTQKFSSLLGKGSNAAVTSVVGAAFSKSGLLSSTQRQALYERTVPKASAKAVNASVKQKGADEDRSHLVTLEAKDGGGKVEFVVMPEVVENRNVAYEAVQPPQFPGAFQKYKGTDSVQWTLNVTFVARTTLEATTNLRYLNMLRGWTMPFYGENTRAAYPNRLGAPPRVLILKGLRDKIIGEVPVVITSLNWNWPRDVDYIPAYPADGDESDGPTIPFPTVMTLAIQLVESFSTTEFNQFDLNQYSLGNMKKAFGQRVGVPAERQAMTGQVGNTQEAQTVPFAGALRGIRSDSVANASRRVGTEVGRATSAVSKVKAISERVTAVYIYPARLPISPTATEGNVEDLGLG